MLKDKWDEKHGINLPAHTTWSNGVQATRPGNMLLHPFQEFHQNDHQFGTTSECSIPQQSNLHDGRPGLSINRPISVEPVSVNHFHHQKHLLETQLAFNTNTYGNGIEKISTSSHKMASQSNHLFQNMLDEDTDKPCSQIGNLTENSLVGANLKELIKILSANYGHANLEMGTPEYMKLVEILQQSSVQPNGFFARGTSTTPSIEIASLAPSTSTEQDEKKLPSEKAQHLGPEKLWDGSLQLSSSVTLSASAFYKSGEKLVGNNWPEFIEVKGKVRLEAFEKYVQDLPRSRNRGLMVTSISWNEESSNTGLNGMKEVAKGYKKSSRVGFAHLLSGIDLYICPRSNPIITILAKYGFFKGMSVIDDKPDSMIGCVVWRKNQNRPSNTSDVKNSPNPIQPQNSPLGFSKQGSEKKHSPESSQHDEPLTLPLTTISQSQTNITAAEVDYNDVNSSSSSISLQISARKRSFEDDDLPEFDFGKSTVLSKTLVYSQKLDNSLLTQVSLENSTKKIKLFVDDDDDMPEWRPPELHNQLPPQTTTSSFQNLLLYPPRPPLPPLPPVPPPPRADTHSSFSFQPLPPGISSQPPKFLRPPPPPPPRPPQPPQPPQQLPPPPPRPPQQPPRQLPATSLPMFNPSQGLWRHPGSFSVNPQFPPSNRRRF